MKPHARRRSNLRYVRFDMLQTICQLEQELNAYDAKFDAMYKRMRQARARMLLWARRYRRRVEGGSYARHA